MIANRAGRHSPALDDAWLAALDLDPQAWPAAHATPSDGGQRIARRALRPNLGSPKTAREFTRRTFSAWHLEPLYNDVVVVVSELVTNALCHGLTGASYSALARPVHLMLLARERRVVIAVADPSDRTPVLASTKHFAENGRGLRIVAVMSDAWGWVPFATGGKAVWAAFDIPDEFVARNR
jgi:hypothetical protein